MTKENQSILKKVLFFFLTLKNFEGFEISASLIENGNIKRVNCSNKFLR